MSLKTQHFSPELRAFVKVFDELSYRHDYARVFDDFLTVFLTQFTAPGLMEYEHRQAVSPYDAKERKLINQLCYEFVLAHDRSLKAMHAAYDVKYGIGKEKSTHTAQSARQVVPASELVKTGMIIPPGSIQWIDLLGTFYEELLAGGYKSKMLGQFFSPPSICDMMAMINVSNTDGKQTGAGLRISDCSGCGSGRMALAANALAPGNYYSLVDLDPMCCKMACINLLLHGIMGEVICADGLDPADYRKGWAINMHLNKRGLETKFIDIQGQPLPLTGIPHIFPQEKEKSYYWNCWNSPQSKYAIAASVRGHQESPGNMTAGQQKNKENNMFSLLPKMSTKFMHTA